MPCTNRGPQPAADTLRGRARPADPTAAVALAGLLAAALPAPAAAWELSGTKAVVATTADGSRLTLGAVRFEPGADGAVTFRLALDTGVFSDHFLSMREFKCLPGPTELSCHVPYPYAHPATVKPGQFAWLEHSLLFFYKLPAEFGARLWNGIYFEFRQTESGLVGKPQAIDLNLIGAPPANLAVPPYRPALRDDMPAQARWIRTLSIE